MLYIKKNYKKYHVLTKTYRHYVQNRCRTGNTRNFQATYDKASLCETNIALLRKTLTNSSGFIFYDKNTAP